MSGLRRRILEGNDFVVCNWIAIGMELSEYV
jgi:hypothetical protein